MLEAIDAAGDYILQLRCLGNRNCLDIFAARSKQAGGLFELFISALRVQPGGG
jgi:hypothetical protein